MSAFGFTKQEKNVVLFLVLSLFLGVSVKTYQFFFVEAPQVHTEPVLLTAVEKGVSETRLGSDSKGLPQSAQIALSSKPKAKKEKSVRRIVTVDLNKATAEELEQVPRIGPTLAGRIILFRDQHGAFDSVSELTKVKGVGKLTFKKMEPYLYVNK